MVIHKVTHNLRDNYIPVYLKHCELGHTSLISKYFFLIFRFDFQS